MQHVLKSDFMSRIEKPTLKLKFELEIPVEEGPTKKFSVSRTLKARWCDDPEKVTNDVMKEILQIFKVLLITPLNLVIQV